MMTVTHTSRNLTTIALLVSIVSCFLFNVTLDGQFKDLVGAWNNTHYAINYIEFGFVKRGLVGSIYYLTFGEIKQSYLVLTQISFIALFIWATFIFFRSLGMQNSRVHLLFLIAPATLMQFASDFGRFDVLLTCCFLLSLSFLQKNLMIALGFAIVGILIHEIYVFTFLPATFLILAVTKNKGNTFLATTQYLIKQPSVYFTLVFIVTVLIFGKFEGGYLNLLTAFEKKGIPLITDPSGSIHVWSRSISDNIGFTIEHKLRLNLAMAGSVFTVIITIIYFKLLGTQLRKFQYLLIVACYLPLFLLGTDYARWISLAFITLFCTFVMIEKEPVSEVVDWRLKYFSLYGPFGYSGFPPILIKIKDLAKQLLVG
ncbi:hypothetical protein [Pseudoalteromonas spongiae]|uniref:hypothetical protein n=1 Tax=Pseudoalteromonas spongiae TaxID=298657 RepID=UPI00110A8087|nr:hypothetical protein [Pseudoalteromonas spongiae]TMO83724.1 hypothetical protein CWC15_13575 [Pseudoalteromonas spongiae]